jgi:hypothetical protein
VLVRALEHQLHIMILLNCVKVLLSLLHGILLVVELIFQKLLFNIGFLQIILIKEEFKI